MNGIDISKVFIIAEAGINHNGRLDLAYKLVDIAKDAGADAVKFQTFRSENLVSKLADKAFYQKESTDSNESQLEMIKRLELSFEDFRKLKTYCDKKKIIFLSTPFDFESVDFLEELIPLYKISSGEINNFPLLEYIAKKGKPIILSTGMATLGEVEEAINTIINANYLFFRYNYYSLMLLHCTSSYPADIEDINLRAMLTLKEAFKFPVGYSDHTLGIEIPVAAVALGAKIIEKHFTLDRNLVGPDHKMSLEPKELKAMVKAVRNVEKALGNGIKKPAKKETEVMKVARTSLIATRDIKSGEVLKESDIAIKRPSIGIPPKFKKVILGMKVTRDIKKDTPFRWEDFKNDM